VEKVGASALISISALSGRDAQFVNTSVATVPGLEDASKIIQICNFRVCSLRYCPPFLTIFHVPVCVQCCGEDMIGVARRVSVTLELLENVGQERRKFLPGLLRQTAVPSTGHRQALDPLQETHLSLEKDVCSAAWSMQTGRFHNLCVSVWDILSKRIEKNLVIMFSGEAN
jgi:hypothetical protein